MEELKELPKVLKKYERVIEKVQFSKKTKESKAGEYGYTVTLNKEYMIDGKPQKVVKAPTVKLARKIIRANRLLSSLVEKKEKQPKAKAKAKTTKTK